MGKNEVEAGNVGQSTRYKKTFHSVATDSVIKGNPDSKFRMVILQG